MATNDQDKWIFSEQIVHQPIVSDETIRHPQRLLAAENAASDPVDLREDRILPHLAALHLALAEHAAGQRRRRTRRSLDVRYQASPEDVIGYLRERQVTLIYNPAAGTLNAGTGAAAQTITLTAN
jgi:hypothetical protein